MLRRGDKEEGGWRRREGPGGEVGIDGREKGRTGRNEAFGGGRGGGRERRKRAAGEDGGGLGKELGE